MKLFFSFIAGGFLILCFFIYSSIEASEKEFQHNFQQATKMVVKLEKEIPKRIERDEFELPYEDDSFSWVQNDIETRIEKLKKAIQKLETITFSNQLEVARKKIDWLKERHSSFDATSDKINDLDIRLDKVDEYSHAALDYYKEKLKQNEDDLENLDKKIREAEAKKEKKASMETSRAIQEAQVEQAPSSATTAPVSPAPAPQTGLRPFSNCTEARRAGRVNIPKGDPQYGWWLDRDGDGIGCED